MLRCPVFLTLAMSFLFGGISWTVFMMRNTEVLPRIVFEIGFGIGIAEASIFAHVLSIYFDRNCITRLGCEPWDIIRVLMVAQGKGN